VGLHLCAGLAGSHKFQTTLDLYTQEESSKAQEHARLCDEGYASIAAQNAAAAAVVASRSVELREFFAMPIG
jgi:hypothetical protein